MRLISEEDAAEFIKSLANQTPTQQLDSNFDQHCKRILDETTTGERMKLSSTSTFNEDSCSRRNLKIQSREELLRLYEGRNGREKSFYLSFPAPVISFPPWFFSHHAGDVTLCQLTRNLFGDQTWVGLELYVVFTRRASASRDGDKSFLFHVELCAHDPESTVMLGSLKIDSCLGTSGQLVVLHLPRAYFLRRLKKCQGINALFRSTDPEMKVQVCGSRLLFKRDLQDLIHSLVAAAGTLGEPVRAQPCSRAYICMVEGPISEAQAVDWHRNKNRKTEKKKEDAETVDQGNKVEGANPISSSCRFERRIVQVLREKVPTSSITRLQHYRNQGSVDFDMDNRGSNQEYVAEEDAPSLLSCHHLRIMTETLFYGSNRIIEWKRCLELLLQYSKAATINYNGHTVLAFKHFNPSSTYNICCYSRVFPCSCSAVSQGSRVGIELPPQVFDDYYFRGLVICAAIRVHDRRPRTSLVKLLCQLRAEDYCLHHVPTRCITKENLDPLLLDGFTWLTYIPVALLTEFNAVRDVEARFHIDCPDLIVDTCGIKLSFPMNKLNKHLPLGT